MHSGCERISVSISNHVQFQLSFIARDISKTISRLSSISMYAFCGAVKNAILDRP